MKRQTERKGRALAFLALEPHAAVMAQHELARQVQADAQARRVLVWRAGMRAKEPLEDAALLCRRNANAMIVHRHHRLFALASTLDLDGTALRRVLDRVRDQVRQHLLDS